MSSARLDYEALFDATPTPYLLITRDLVIVGMNRARERVTGTRREDVVGRDIFEVFPDNPQDATATGVQNLRASLERVLASKKPDTMPMQRYDLADPATGTFVQRWWSPVNVPVVDDTGRVALLLHRVTDVTEWMQVRSRRNGVTEPGAAEADSDLYARTQELHDAWKQASVDIEHFRAAMVSQRGIGQALGLLMERMNITSDEAFQFLTVESQHRNVKLRDVAAGYVEEHNTHLRPAASPPS